VLSEEAGDRLANTWRMLSDLQQLLRITVDGDFTPEAAPAPLCARIAALLGAQNAEEAEQRLGAMQQAVRADFVQIIGAPGDGSAPLVR
jgi:Lon protease-like protein